MAPAGEPLHFRMTGVMTGACRPRCRPARQRGALKAPRSRRTRRLGDAGDADGAPDETGHRTLEPAAILTLDHVYLSIQAGIDGLGVAMGPATLIEDDLRAGRLLTPFPAVSLPAHSYFADLPSDHPSRPANLLVCDWIAGLGEGVGARV